MRELTRMIHSAVFNPNHATSASTLSLHDALPIYEMWPETHLEGIGQDAVKCDKCGNAVKPFEIVHGYTVIFDETRQVGVTVPKEIGRATSELQSRENIVCRLWLEKKKIRRSGVGF